MVVADTNYGDTLEHIEQAKVILQIIEDKIRNQIPQGLAGEFNNSKSVLINWLEELEYTLISYS